MLLNLICVSILIKSKYSKATSKRKLNEASTYYVVLLKSILINILFVYVFLHVKIFLLGSGDTFNKFKVYKTNLYYFYLGNKLKQR